MTIMQTQHVATLELDSESLSKDLEHSASFRYSEAYSNYLIGGPWKSCMLYSRGGRGGDGFLTNYSYDVASAFTAEGAELPYVQSIITDTVDLTRLNFARLAVFSDSVIIPHRDFIELADIPAGQRSAHRVHIPLATHDECFFSDEDTVYRMRAGEVWFFDAARIHSVASFSASPRIHLILDFVDEPGAALVTVPGAVLGNGIPAGSVIERPPLPEADRQALAALVGVLTLDTFKEVFAIVIKKHFRFDGGANFAWRTMTQLARNCGDPAVLDHAAELRRYFELERSN